MRCAYVKQGSEVQGVMLAVPRMRMDQYAQDMENAPPLESVCVLLGMSGPRARLNAQALASLLL